MDMLGFESFFRTVLVVSQFRLFFLMLLVLSVLLFQVVEFAEGGGVLGAFLRYVRGEIGAIGGAAGFHFRDFLGGKSGGRFRVNFHN